MTEPLDPVVTEALARLRVEDETPDWAGVQARARARERRRGGVRRRRFYIAAAATVLLVIAAPALAFVAHEIFQSPAVPGTITAARVELGRGAVATVKLHSHGDRLARGREGFYFPTAGDEVSRDFEWAVRLEGTQRLRQVRIAVDGTFIVLCNPCADASHGRFTAQDGAALQILNGQARLEIGTLTRRLPPAAGGRLGMAVSERSKHLSVDIRR